MSDANAICRLKSGDIAGLEAMVVRYQASATQAAFLILHDEQLAEDVVQDTFVRLYHHIRSFDTTCPFEPYLFRCVINAALNAIRRSSTWVQLRDQDMEWLEQLIVQAASIEEQAFTRELRQEILAALAHLPPRQRAVIVQRYYLEMSEQEMAQAMQAPRETIKWLLNQARTRLQRLLGFLPQAGVVDLTPECLTLDSWKAANQKPAPLPEGLPGQVLLERGAMAPDPTLFLAELDGSAEKGLVFGHGLLTHGWKTASFQRL